MPDPPADGIPAGINLDDVPYIVLALFALINNVNIQQLCVIVKFLLQEGDVEALREFMLMVGTNDIAKFRRHPWKDFHVIALGGLIVAATTPTQQ